MKKCVLLVFALFALSVTALAETLADSAAKEIPLGSVAKLKAYALTQVNQVAGGVSGQTVSGANWFSAPFTPDGNPLSIAAALKQNKLSYSVDPADKLTNFAEWLVRMADGSMWPAFHGESADFTLVKDSAGNYQVPTAALKMDLDFIYAPVAFAGVIDAYIILKDSSGMESGRVYLGQRGFVRDGYIVFTADFTGQTGDLHVVFRDNSKAIYGLPASQKKSTAQVSSGGFETTAKGIRVLADNALEILYKATDDVIRVKYTVNASVIVRFEPGVQLPILVTVYDEATLKSNPNAPGVSFDPSKIIVTFSAKAGETKIILFDKPTPKLTGGGGGKD